ncbi:CRISPR-associated helicase Cas3' [Flectobacillus sp. DC10W]|uniref:CRISPR-associated helicase Cas3 n=1 Tax=Flectobacillus longus TaxID=2984207 RepID=A0ABT6YK62_9BACT|nr:CRISPR-associated helicase Cas3' [Flectobacillus longus]MDI9863920.1 CRISPR-associated helicase Cas3' [Flectobacillus longus]
MSIEEYYKEIFSDNIVPYSYQVAVAKKLLEGKNVILQVPTGAGKTWASIMPFLYARETGLDSFPKKMIYSLPLRTLANSIYDDVFDVLQKNGYDEEEIKRQTGEYSDDPYFEKDIIFSTIDQTLSNFLCFPLPLSPRQANINAGALIGSYLVFDEFHLLDSELSMATTIGTLKMLGNLCRCCIMTATLSEDFMNLMTTELGGDSWEIITLDEFKSDEEKIGSLLPKLNKKEIFIIDKPLNAKDIVEKHNSISEKGSFKTIVLCNQVESAQRIYLELKKVQTQELPNTNIICLHSRFFDEDRKKIESQLKKWLGRKSKENIILISTQVIEAGIDISCKILHTEISPINSFLQRAGRCARYEEETGKIFVYDVGISEEIDIEYLDEEGEAKKLKEKYKKYLPYPADLCLKTLEALRSTQNLDGNIPKELTNTILSLKEQEDWLKMSSLNIGEIENSWKEGNKKAYRKTIRDINSIEIVILDDLESSQNNIKNPFIYQSIGVYRFSFYKWIKELEVIAQNEDQWLMAVAKPKKESSFDFDWQDTEGYCLEKLNSLYDLKMQYPDIVFVDKRYFSYSTEIGMNRLNYGEVFSPYKPFSDKNKEVDYQYKKDTFYEHNMALLGCFEQEFFKDDKQLFTFNEFNNLFKTNLDFEKLIKLMIVFHDYGKLNKNWQLIMQMYQAQKEAIPLKNFKEVLAHSTTENEKDNELMKQVLKKMNLPQKPSHAGIGAVALWNTLYELFNDPKDEKWFRPFCHAILCHHSPTTSSYPKFDTTLYKQEMKKLLQEINFNFDLDIIIDNEERGEFEFISEKSSQWLLYFYLVRILRLCDQRATVNMSKYYNP